MNLTPYEIALIAGGFTIVGTLIGAIIGNRNAISLNKIVEFNKAAATFRSAFTSELRELKTIIKYDMEIVEDDITKMLGSSAIKFENACIIFRPYLKKSKRICFNNAWKEYCHPQGGDPKKVPGPFYEYFVNKNNNDAVNLIIDKIEKMIGFAKPI